MGCAPAEWNAHFRIVELACDKNRSYKSNQLGVYTRKSFDDFPPLCINDAELEELLTKLQHTLLNFVNENDLPNEGEALASFPHGV